MDAKDRAQNLLDQVKAGKTIFFRAGKEWMIMGPAATLQEGARVVVTKADGSADQVIVGLIASDRTVQGTAARTALFRKAPTFGPPAVAEPTRYHQVADRSAAFVGGALSRDTRTGSCHYCGGPLDRRGRCPECI